MRLPVWRRRLAILLDRQWSQPLPIYTYLIEHDESLILLRCSSPWAAIVAAGPQACPWAVDSLGRPAS